jgi:PiT family inorganic phosphate transporter
MWQLASGGILGWALGANDASNVFGTAVASRMLRFRTAALAASACIVLGALVGGGPGMRTYQDLGRTDLDTAFVVCLTAALTVTLMTWRRLPVSTSQAVVGALVAVSALGGSVDLGVLGKVVLCWVGTPIGAALLAVLLYVVLGQLVNALGLNLFRYDVALRSALMVAGCYGAFALGANNVANVTGPFVGDGMLSVPGACLVGGLCIALGVVTYSRGVMMTVGRGLVKLDAFSALVVVLAEALAVHAYALVGVPVSTSQAVVGGVLGIGLVRGIRTVNKRTLLGILGAWLLTPVVAFAGTLLLCLAAVRMGWLASPVR